MTKEIPLILALVLSLFVQATLTTIQDKAQEKPQPEALAKSEWIKERKVSPIDDKVTTSMMLPASTTVTSWLGQTAQPYLIFVCSGKTAYFYVHPRVSLQRGDTVEVRLRLDDGEPFRELWPLSSTYDVILPRNNDRVASWLGKHSKLAFEFTPYKTGPQAVLFDLSSGAEVAQAYKACKDGLLK